MPTLRENELVFDFRGALRAKKLDGHDHGLSHCMKAVDFVVEYEDHELYVEVKDPDQTGATPDRREQFAKKRRSDELIADLARKYRDSWIYRWSHHHDKPVRYVVLLQLSTLSDALLLSVADRLKRELPVLGPAGAWPRPFVRGAAVLDIRRWNAFGRYGTVRRILVPS